MSATKEGYCAKYGHNWQYAGGCSNCGITEEEYRAKIQKYVYDISRACTCGAEKAGFDSHTAYCDKGTK